MPRSKITESHMMKIEGLLDIENMTVEVDEIGVKELSELLGKFNGCNVKISVTLNNDIE